MNQILNDWQGLELCIEYSALSTDLSTKNCAIIIPTDGSLFVTGVNTPPPSLYLQSRLQKPDKHKYTTHAERKAVYSCAKLGRCTEGATMYALWVACIGCAQAIIEAGIVRIVTLDTTLYNYSQMWSDEVIQGLDMLNEANIKIDRIQPPKVAEGVFKVFIKGEWVNV